jgi:hypothetical protein
MLVAIAILITIGFALMVTHFLRKDGLILTIAVKQDVQQREF